MTARSWVWLLGPDFALGVLGVCDFHGLLSHDSASHHLGFLSPICGRVLNGLSKLLPKT